MRPSVGAGPPTAKERGTNHHRDTENALSSFRFCDEIAWSRRAHASKLNNRLKSSKRPLPPRRQGRHDKISSEFYLGTLGGLAVQKGFLPVIAS
jgi:hypothetical protein